MGFTILEQYVKSIVDLLSRDVSSGTITSTQTLSGTLVPLSKQMKCKSVTFLSNVTISTGNGESIDLTSSLNVPCNYPSDILVSGSGTLSYIIIL